MEAEFSRLKDICYLDHIGAGLYADSQLEAIIADLKRTLYSNPHSSSISSIFCRDNVDQIRNRILNHFGTTSEEYYVIFTANTTQSLKIVIESFDWTSSNGEKHGHFIYTRDNHTSVLGMRELIDTHKVGIHCLEHVEAFDLFARRLNASREITGGNSLFAYSAQCNFAGCKYPLTWVKQVHNGILNELISTEESSKWFCLLDVASYVPTSELNLSQHQADFVTLSFYKMFGYPTGLGALLVRKSSSHVLRKRYYGGGTILMTLSNEMFHKKRENFTEVFEDGTVNYLAILSLAHGFDTLQRLGENMRVISMKVFSLARHLHEKFLTLHHSNGNPAVKLYRDTDYSDHQTQGGVVNFNLLRSNSQYIGYTEVLHILNLFGIQLRTGCFCNPGACQRHLGWTNEQLKINFKKGHSCADQIDLLDGYPTGSIRVSFGYSSTEDDANKLFDTILNCFVSKPAVFKSPITWGKEARILKEKFDPFKEFDTTHSQNTINVINSANLRRTPVSKHRLDAKLVNIFVFPIKSCGAFAVPERWPISGTGLMYDREWMIISANGVALTQKQAPQMCLIKPRICLLRHNLILEFKDPSRSTTTTISVSLHKVSDSSSEINPLCWSKVCGDRVRVIDWGDRVAEWLQSVLQIPGLRLVRIINRNSSSRGETLSLANQAQYLLITEASLEWLWEKTSGSVFSCRDNMTERFRSNFVIGGGCLKSLEEFTWKQIQIGNLHFEVKGACNRCYIICIDQSTGEKNHEPFITLASAQEGKIKFGIYLNLVGIDGPSYVKVKDNIVVEYVSL